jgi:lysophospholipid acyltransferase (LPLAT)-like uncharacterized protein
MIEPAQDLDGAEPGGIRESPAQRTRASHRWKVARRKAGRRAASFVGAPVVRALSRTWRHTVAGEEHLRSARGDGRGYFMALWHGRMLIPAARHANQGYCILVSPSGDGDVSDTLLRRLGYGVVRGSTSRQGREALRTMLDLLRNGTPIAITPDGPRGPRGVMTQGLAWMASVTGFPVVPCGFVTSSSWHLKSWDRFTIPKPFAKVAYVYEEPIFVARKSEGSLEQATETIRAAMVRAEQRGFELLGVESDG